MKSLSVFTGASCKNPLEIESIIQSVFIAYKRIEELRATKEKATITHPHFYTHPDRAEIFSFMVGQPRNYRNDILQYKSTCSLNNNVTLH